MKNRTPATDSVQSSRRDFLRTSATGFVSATAASGLGPLPAVHAGGSDTLRIGLIGCGGRGTGAASDAMNADPNVKLVAMGDMFRDRLEQSRATLKKLGGSKFDVKDDHCFVGFDAYQHVIASGVDVVVLATPPHFRPAHIKAAIDAGKHIFAEKPVAVDAPGVRSVLASCEEARKKNLSVVSGLCWRYHKGMRETIQQVHGGTVGRVVALQCNYNAGALWMKPRQPGWTEMEWQLRNWLYFTWLSGDHNVEQHVHSLDKMAWVMKDEYPVRAVGMGGRQARTQPEYGHIFDHHAVCYEFAGGVRCFSFCRQQAGTAHDVSDWVFGTNGTADLMRHSVAGETAWRYRLERNAPKENMYQQEHDELFASIRSGHPINNGEYMAKSTLMAIMGRMATYTGQVITWEQALHSTEDLTPPKYEFGPLPVPPVAVPGVTRLS